MKSRYVFLLMLAALALLPLVLMLMGSIKSPIENLRIPPTLFPKVLSLEGYQTLLKYPLWQWTVNTVVVCICFTALNLLFTTFFGFSIVFRIGPRGRFLAIGAMLALFLGTETMLIPRYLLVRSMGLFNTRLAMIMPFLPIPMYGLLCILYLRSFPRYLIDSAEIDGCRTLGQIFRIVVPNIRPFLAVIGFFSFSAVYGMFMWQALVAPKHSVKTLSVGLALVVFNDLSNYTQAFPTFSLNLAGATIAFIPLFLVFLLSRRYFKSHVFHQGVMR